MCFFLLFLLIFSFYSRLWYYWYGIAIIFSAFTGLTKFGVSLVGIFSCISFACVMLWHDKHKGKQAFFIGRIWHSFNLHFFYWLFAPSHSDIFAYLRSIYEFSTCYNIYGSLPGGRQRAIGLVFIFTILYVAFLLKLYRHHEKIFFLP